jgi:DNA invertase Pin-like site-specific DNA recombinase
VNSVPLTPVAQYIRMSTEHQRFSLENQTAALQLYAEKNNYDVVKTYVDAGKSGLVLKHRKGLAQLLHDVVQGRQSYRVILVYDVSRWGRFQDTDEAAYYEFLCKRAGVLIHYCAETFSNDATMSSAIMKALKRVMAGEYSRELGVKVLAGHKRLARLGFRQGGVPGYGLRRMLVSASGIPKQELAAGDQKSLSTDRVILVLGPALEVRVVKDIYRMLVSGKLSISAIARELNRRGVAYLGGANWTYQGVRSVLTAQKYTGYHIYARTSARLLTARVKLPRSEWVVTPAAFEPIIDPLLFSEAQRVLQQRTLNKSDEDLLHALRALLAAKGRLSRRVLRDSTEVPSPSTYIYRFGSLYRAYELIGYGRAEDFGPVDLRRRTQALREELIAQIATMFPDDVSVIRPGGKWRTRLHLRNGLMVSVLVGRPIQRKCITSWRIDPVMQECEFVTLLARLDKENRAFLDFHLLPNMDRRKRFHVSLTDPWLSRGQPLNDLNMFYEATAAYEPAA